MQSASDRTCRVTPYKHHRITATEALLNIARHPVWLSLDITWKILKYVNEIAYTAMEVDKQLTI